MKTKYKHTKNVHFDFITCASVFPPDQQGVNLHALVGVTLKLIEEREEERNDQVHQRHHEGNQERLGLIQQRPGSRVQRLQ